jgi:heat shock protein HspQ
MKSVNYATYVDNQQILADLRARHVAQPILRVQEKIADR